MKNRVILICLAILFVCGCSKEKNGCPPPSITVSVLQGTSGIVGIQESSGNYGFVEAEYGPNGFSRGNGTVITFSTSHQLTLAGGTYDIYVRGNCGGGNWSDWSNPESFFVATNTLNCPTPTDLTYDSNEKELNWFFGSGSYADYWEVEYGPAGFTIGTGTRVTVNENKYATDFTSGSKDFYVRSNCNSTWSAWGGPRNFVVSDDRDEFVGTYNAEDGCATLPYLSTISKLGNSDSLLISDFGLFSCSGDYPDVVAVLVNAASFVIPTQTFCSGDIVISGNGYIDTGGFPVVIEYTEIGNGNTRNCTAELTKL